MARLFVPILVLMIQVLGTCAVGCWLLLTPVRAANQLHEAFLVFPQVDRDDHVKKLCLRLLGVGLIVLATKAGLGFFSAAEFLANRQ